ncbi:MAG: EcsC family protein [Clostridia bacterium]|nr:EcsC family protein [Clostridia bacterium]
MTDKVYSIPSPIIDEKEERSLAELTDRYTRLLEPNLLGKMGKAVGGIIPEGLKVVGKATVDSIADAKLYQEAMKVIAEGFSMLESQAAKFSISESAILQKVNGVVVDNEITEVTEICLARGYELSRLVNAYKIQDQLWALGEGGVTGVFGFAGLPFNLVLSTFLFYRAVQSVAMFYGYDVKNDPSEMVIASEVFVSALGPTRGGSTEMSSLIAKIMLISELTTVKQAAKKTWEKMAVQGGIGLVLTQIRALANSAAAKALEKAGRKGLENSLFSGVFRQIGKGLTKKAISKSIPYFSAVLGACFDTVQMKRILEYADVFYNKRFLVEKEVRVHSLIQAD